MVYLVTDELEAEQTAIPLNRLLYIGNVDGDMIEDAILSLLRDS